jgi:hypothetical protein
MKSTISFFLGSTLAVLAIGGFYLFSKSSQQEKMAPTILARQLFLAAQNYKSQHSKSDQGITTENLIREGFLDQKLANLIESEWIIQWGNSAEQAADSSYNGKILILSKKNTSPAQEEISVTESGVIRQCIIFAPGDWKWSQLKK